MLFIMFTSSEANEINCFKKITLKEACELTNELEKQYQGKGIIAQVHFYLLNDKDEELYTGTLRLGSNYAQNIYHHIYKKLSAHKFSKQQEEKKRELFQSMEDELPSHLKDFAFQSTFDQVAATKEPSLISPLQKKLLYGAGAAVLVISLSLNFIHQSTINNYQSAMASANTKLENEEKLASIYEDALSGNSNAALDKFSKMKKLSSSEKKVYINLLLSEKKYEEAVKVSGGDISSIEAMLFKQGNADILKDFNNAFPSKSGEFDIAYLEQRWKDVVSVKGVTMNDKRHEMRSYAFLKNGKLKEAKSEAEKANSSELDEKIVKFEKAQKALDDTKKQLAEENKKDSKDENKIKSLTEQQKKQEEEIKSI